MFNLSFGELIVLAALGLIFIGPKQLPQLARILGKTLAELKKAINDVKTSVTSELIQEKKQEAKTEQKLELPKPPQDTKT